MINVMIDATCLTLLKAGVGVYGKNLIEQLVLADQINLFLAVQDDDVDFNLPPRPNLTVLRMPSRLLRNVALRVIFEQTVMPWLLRSHRIDVLHSLHYSFPLLRGGVRSAVTIHDMTSLSMPEVHIGLKMRYYRFFIRQARTRSDGLIFVSRSAQQDFVARLGSPSGLSAVVYHGKSSNFQSDIAEQKVADVRAKYKLPLRYVLYVGTIEPRKNLERLIKAFTQASDEESDLYLVLAGMTGWKQDHLVEVVARLGMSDKVLFPGFVAEEHKAALIAGCELFIYPSLYEGFGLPVLEALASGKPTITSNVSSLPEVAGDAALLVDPKDVSALASAISSILSDPVLAAELRRRGPEQAAKFTWARTAEETMAVYRALAERPAVRTSAEEQMGRPLS